jgi:hypothetical protein
MPLGRIIRRESRVIDGVAYEVVAYAMPGGVYGTFSCPFCGVTEISAMLGPNEENVLRETRAGVDSHHAERHRQQATADDPADGQLLV